MNIRTWRRCAGFSAALWLSGCATHDLPQALERTRSQTRDYVQADWQLSRTEAQRQQRQAATERLLSAPVGSHEAVQLMLANSPAFQALLAQYAADAALAAQSGRLANPVLTFESVVSGSEREWTRFLSLGLLDVLTLPQRVRWANQKVEWAQIRLASELIDRVTQVRQAWIRAVAAEQTLAYAQQVFESAQASAELARRMESVGNFNRITRARHQAFYADAATQWVAAQQNQGARREELIRLLGLDQAQSQALRLPARLPDVPPQALSGSEVGQRATRQRLDVQMAQASLNAAARLQGWVGITSYTDLELTARRGNITDSETGNRTTSRGYEVGVRLPVFDWGDLRRDAANAQTLAAMNNLESTWRLASSSLREAYAAYRAAHDVSLHYKQEVIPLRKVIADENVLRYNGMIIGVFELLADARDQVSAVMSAIAADQQFWLAEAALQSNLIGRPVGAPSLSPISTPASATVAH